jgi:voltage-gated potassium channel
MTTQNLRLLVRFFVALVLLICLYSVLFHVFMAREGREFSWFTGVYWTLTVMSTLGFGDITFTGDLGRAFTLWVLVSGGIFMMVLLPFSFIQFFWAPWMEAQAAAQVPRRLTEKLSGHVLITHVDDITHSLISRLRQYNTPHVILVTDPEEALALQDQGLRALVGQLDDPDFYREAQVADAAFVAATGLDTLNTSVAHTIREIESEVPIIATARDPASVDILELAGCTQVIQLAEMLGQSLARRVSGSDAAAREIGSFDDLVIAESTPSADWIGHSLDDIGLRRELGISVIGVWDCGRFETALPTTKLGTHTVLVIAGARAQIDRFNEASTADEQSKAPVIIIGGGRVGRAVGRALEDRGLDFRIIEELEDRALDSEHYVIGSAAHLEVLQEAGIDRSPAVVITTSDDRTNLYLAIYCRRLRADTQVIARANAERNIDPLHRAGADFVMSYASMGANAIVNLLQRGDALMVDEGLDVFRTPIPKSLVGKSIADSDIRRSTGCTVVALKSNGQSALNPDPHTPMPADSEIILIGTVEAEKRFYAEYCNR